MKAENNREEVLFREALKKAKGLQRSDFLAQAWAGIEAA
jgi:hypothetical protein